MGQASRLSCPVVGQASRLSCPCLPQGHADEPTVLKQTIEADRYSIWIILISTGETPNPATEKMVWYSLIGLASLEELEVFSETREESSPTVW